MENLELCLTHSLSYIQFHQRTLSGLPSQWTQGQIPSTSSRNIPQHPDPDTSPDHPCPGSLQKLSLPPPGLLPSILNRAAKVLQLKTEVGSHLLSAQSPPLISSLFQHKSHRPHDGLLYPSPTSTSLISYPISLPIAYSAPATLASLLLRRHTSVLRPLYFSSRGKVFQAQCL